MSVIIRGKEYHTVAERINALHTAKAEQYEILTDIHTFSPPLVIVRATVRIHTANGPREYNGHAYEMMDQGQINSTSALENCETSAIGRALAAAGYGGTEYASANEVENAIHKQENGKTETPPASNKPNKYKGPCGRCEQEVAAEAGYSQKVGDKWMVFHHECPAAQPGPTTTQEKVTQTVSDNTPCTPTQYSSLIACLSRTDLTPDLIEQAAFLVDNPTITLNGPSLAAFQKAGHDVVKVPAKVEADALKAAVVAYTTRKQREEESDGLPF